MSHADSAMTLDDLFNAYMENHARVHCKCWREFERMYASHLAHWGSRPADSITRFEVQQFHAGLARDTGPPTANKMLAMLCAVYNRCIQWELLDKNPASGLKKVRLKSRERFLEKNELEAFFTAVQSLRYKTTRDFLLMCLATGARRCNVAAMRWDQISLDRATWHMPDTKNGTPHILPLTSFAMEILQQRLKEKLPNAEWVFPSERSPSGHLTKPEKAWQAVVERAGLTDVRVHDLRRTLASYQAMTGANMAVIAKTLNHRDMKSVQVYARLQIEPVREAMEKATLEMCGAQPKTAQPTLPPSPSTETAMTEMLGHGSPPESDAEAVEPDPVETEPNGFAETHDEIQRQRDEIERQLQEINGLRKALEEAHKAQREQPLPSTSAMTPAANLGEGDDVDVMLGAIAEVFAGRTETRERREALRMILAPIHAPDVEALIDSLMEVWEPSQPPNEMLAQLERGLAITDMLEQFNVETREEREGALEMILASMSRQAEPQNLKDAYKAWNYDCSDDYAVARKHGLTGEHRDVFLDHVARHRDVERMCIEAGDADSFDFEMEAHERANADRSLLRGKNREPKKLPQFIAWGNPTGSRRDF